MAKFHQKQIDRARQNITCLPDDPTDALARTARVVSWIILRDSRPVAAPAAGRILRFPAPLRPELRQGGIGA